MRHYIKDKVKWIESFLKTTDKTGSRTYQQPNHHDTATGHRLQRWQRKAVWARYAPLFHPFGKSTLCSKTANFKIQSQTFGSTEKLAGNLKAKRIWVINDNILKTRQNAMSYYVRTGESIQKRRRVGKTTK